MSSDSQAWHHLSLSSALHALHQLFSHSHPQTLQQCFVVHAAVKHTVKPAAHTGLSVDPLPLVVWLASLSSQPLYHVAKTFLPICAWLLPMLPSCLRPDTWWAHLAAWGTHLCCHVRLTPITDYRWQDGTCATKGKWLFECQQNDKRHTVYRYFIWPVSAHITWT